MMALNSTTATRCERCGRRSYGFPLCSWCRRKANDGRVIGDQVVRWDKRAKVFKVEG